MHKSGIIERIAEWVACAVSLVLWTTLDSDLNNALWRAAKMDAHQIEGTVRPEKIVLCLGWSLLVLLMLGYRYRVPVVGMLGLLTGTLIVQASFGFLTINAFAIPGFYLITTKLLAAVAYSLAPIMISAVMAYQLVTRRLFARITESVATALILALCVTMVWIGLFDIIHPGIGWR